MSIDIDKLTEAELIDLNNRIVERLRLLDQMRAHKTMLNFAIGDIVMFEDQNGRTVEGTMIRYNRKSVTILTSEGRRWNVAPGFLRKARGSTKRNTPSLTVVPKK